ncbi:alkaline phytoceramidase [Fomitiporia mediterranea MF3/22]|uniref:alkaline phytoceramidase n=1 Tax=Fomitiporia mediterranea (strain MF3/22) TaxID=694068 RepID=UPI0004408481|nr:alkaline phytoceramidase [Fomitiporia mediterranea MF3/22]EJC98725.1 alkaline phytoceramidase [Fomitiporia mediterranea MF3/22]
MSFPVSDAYNFSRTGAWGTVTSTLDFCEANYQFSDYIAEMANTLSNIITVAIALQAARIVQTQALPARYFFGFMSLAIVGLGSFAFHATLLHSAQLSDELPMIYTASCSLFILYDTSPGWGISSKKSQLLLIFTVLFDILFTYSYWLYRNPIYHQVVFAAFMIANTLRGSWLVRSAEASNRIGLNEKRTITSLYTSGALIFILGFAIWNLDNVFCNALSKWKALVGWPMAFLLEGHAWWHLFTTVGAYIMGIGTTCETLCIKDEPRNYTVEYDAGIYPRVRRVNKKVKM